MFRKYPLWFIKPEPYPELYIPNSVRNVLILRGYNPPQGYIIFIRRKILLVLLLLCT